MKKYQLDQIAEAIDELEAAVIRNGLAKKHLLDIAATRQAVSALRKKVEKGNVR
jgi:ubiquinone biosynthesis protein UbiJ